MPFCSTKARPNVVLYIATSILLSNLSLSAEAVAKPDAAKLTSEIKAQMKAPKEIGNIDDLNRWMTYYYLHPQPELFVSAVTFADKQDLFQGNSLSPLQAFLSRIFAQNPDKIGTWFTELKEIKDGSRTMLLTSIWWSDTKDGAQFLQNLAKQLPEKGRAEFVKQIEKKPTPAEDMPIDSPDVLDMLWACYSATGDEKYVKRLMTVLPWHNKDNKDLNQMLIASAAKWSLTSNAEQHPKVLAICRTVEASDPALASYLQEIIAKATGKAQNKAEPANKKTD